MAKSLQQLIAKYTEQGLTAEQAHERAHAKVTARDAATGRLPASTVAVVARAVAATDAQKFTARIPERVAHYIEQGATLEMACEKALAWATRRTREEGEVALRASIESHPAPPRTVVTASALRVGPTVAPSGNPGEPLLQLGEPLIIR